MTNEQIQALKAASDTFSETLATHRTNPKDFDALNAWDDAASEFMAVVNGDELNIIAALLAEREADKALIEQLRVHNRILAGDGIVKQNRIAELEAAASCKFMPVGVMSQSKFENLDDGSVRFIALWPRPGVPVFRKRPDDGVLVYAKVAGITDAVGGEDATNSR